MLGFRMPTRVHVEPGCLSRLPEACRRLGQGSVLLVADPGLAPTGIPDRARRLLASVGIRVEVFDRLEPNPRTTTVEAAATQARETQVDAVVAIGGGSALDAGKAAAMLAANPGAPAHHFEGRNRFIQRPLPFVAVPTTCGTGSEVTWVSVLTHEPTRSKISVKGDTMFPDQALVDADLLCTLPGHLVAWTGLDALTHALEATTGVAANPVSDALAEKAIDLLFAYLERATRDVAGDAEARRETMRASTLAGLAFGNADVGAVHCLSETLGGLFDVPHGLTNALLLLPVFRHHAGSVEERLASLALLVDRGLDPRVPVSQRAAAFLHRLEGLIGRLGLPTFASFEIPKDAYREVAERSTRNGSNGSNPQPMVARDYLEILDSLG